MIQYLRIPKNKFWGWVFSSLVIGILAGAGAGWVATKGASAGKINDLDQQLASQSSQAASKQQQLQARLDSVEASLNTLTAENQQLKTENEAAKSDQSTTATQTTQTAKLEVLSRKISPSTISTGGSITLTAKIQGTADKVTMRIYSSGGTSTVYSLKKSSTDGDTSIWQRNVDGPKKAGTYHYYATAYSGDKSATMPGASPKTLVVTK